MNNTLSNFFELPYSVQISLIMDPLFLIAIAISIYELFRARYLYNKAKGDTQIDTIFAALKAQKRVNSALIGTTLIVLTYMVLQIFEKIFY